jgi:penicillin-binding protein 1C
MLAAAAIISLLFFASTFWPIPASRLSPSNFESLFLVDRHGALLREVLSSNEGRSRWIELEHISPWVIKSLLHTEDRNFYRHRGLDAFALVRAALQNLRGQRIISGGSTLTQQLARQIHRLPPQPLGKAVEMWLALRLERSLSKEKILEQYLNRAPFGNQCFGIAAASRMYFNKPAAHLTLAEAAFLAGLPQAPSAYDPFRHPERARSRQKRVLQALLRNGAIDSLQFAAAANESLRVAHRPKHFLAPHACDLSRELLTEEQLLSTNTIRLTIDATLQRNVEKILSGNLQLLQRANVTNGAILVLENRTGEVLALVGSNDYFDEQHGGQVNGALALRQPGSALKPFTYGIALERDYTAASILPDVPTNAPIFAGGGDFTPTNYDGRFHGPVRLRTALACSYNVPAVRLLEPVGAELLLQRLQRAGFASLKQNAQHYGLGLTLGNGEVSLLELTRAYLALANAGRVKNLRLFAEENMPRLAPVAEEEIFSSEISFILGDILRDDAARAPAFGEGSVLDLPFSCAVKTGTTKDFRDNWCVGFTSDYTVGVWLGNFDGAAMKKISGVAGAGPIFREVMLLLHRDYSPLPPLRPQNLVKLAICTASGAQPNQFCPNQMQEIFLPGKTPSATCDWHRVVAVPGGGDDLIASVSNQKLTPRIAMIYPALYQPWAKAEGIAQPLLLAKAFNLNGNEQRATSNEQPATSNEQPATNNQQSASSIEITFPDEGDIFKIDPILRPEFQTLLLECVAAEGIKEVTWIVDDEVVKTVGPPFRARWQLRKGEHVLQARGRNEAAAVESAPRKFRVF